jgi:MFS family permease
LGAKAATTTAALLMALSLALMMVIQLPVMLVLMLISIGIGLAIGTVSITWLANYFFGKEEYSKYYGAVQFANCFGIAAGVPVIASALENLGNTKLLWFGLSLVSVVMMFLFMKSIHGNQKEKASLIRSTIES